MSAIARNMKWQFFAVGLVATISGCSTNRLTNGSEESPAAPSDLQGELLSLSAVQLNWLDNSANETGFEIHRSQGGPSEIVGETEADQVSYLDNDLPECSILSYFVLAKSDEGASAPSNIAEVPLICEDPGDGLVSPVFY